MVRRYTAFESMRLMGFTDEDYQKCHSKENVPDAEIYAQCGNSIVVTVLMAIFGELYEMDDWQERVYKERKKTSEQLLYELPLLQAIQEVDR